MKEINATVKYSIKDAEFLIEGEGHYVQLANLVEAQKMFFEDMTNRYGAVKVNWTYSAIISDGDGRNLPPFFTTLEGVQSAPPTDRSNPGADQIRPDHYGGSANPFEPIKIIHHYDLNFNCGNVIKYVLRAGKKGNALEDLKKAATYLSFEIARRTGG